MNIQEANDILFKNNVVKSISIEFDQSEFGYNLQLELMQSPDRAQSSICVEFIDISNLELKCFGGGLNQFMHLSISKNRSGMERIRYQLQENEEDKITFSFKRFHILY